MATVASVASDLATEFGEQYSDLDIKDQFDRWVVEVYQEIALTSRLFFKNEEHDLNLIAGTAEYTLAATVAEPRDISILSPVVAKLAYTPVERLTARGASLAETGQPKAYYISGIDAGTAIKVRVWPVPDQSYTAKVFATARPLALVSTDTIPLPLDYLVALYHGVRARVKFNDNDLQSQAVAQQTYQGLLQALNGRFTGPPPSSSRLGVKRMRGSHQNASAVDGS